LQLGNLGLSLECPREINQVKYDGPVEVIMALEVGFYEFDF